jgi:hypothetical protein
MALRPVDDSFGEDVSGFAPHDRVRIGGRTMLRPGYSLVGREGTVFAVGGWCPANHAQIIVDGETVEEDGGARVLLVNVPLAHLEKLAPRALEADEPLPFRPRLTPLESADEPQSVPQEATPDSEPDNTPPSGLRLV